MRSISNCAQEAGGVVKGIRREIKRAAIKIIVRYANNKPCANKTFQKQAGKVLMKKCDKEAKRKGAELIDTERQHAVKYAGAEVPVADNQLRDKNINVLIREIDATESEKEALKGKIKENCE